MSYIAIIQKSQQREPLSFSLIMWNLKKSCEWNCFPQVFLINIYNLSRKHQGQAGALHWATTCSCKSTIFRFLPWSSSIGDHINLCVKIFQECKQERSCCPVVVKNWWRVLECFIGISGWRGELWQYSDYMRNKKVLKVQCVRFTSI